MKLILLLSFFFSFIAFSLVAAQGIRGRITNSRGEAIPFATIYVPQSTTGTTTNKEGIYELKLSRGKYTIQFQCLGYQTQTVEITVNASFQEKNVQLAEQEYLIPEVKVMASGEDPAYLVVKRAIGMAPYYLKQVSKYSCKVYIKGGGLFEQLKGIGNLFKGQMKELGLEVNKPIVVETLNKVEFEAPDHITQKVLATRSTIKNFNIPGLGIDMAMGDFIYKDQRDNPIAPLGKTALQNYRYRLEGVYTEQGRTINKIKVIPAHSGNNLFSGYIYIAEDYWNVLSADLTYKEEMAVIHLNLLNAEVKTNTYMPVNFNINVDVSGFGVKAKFNGVISISEYNTTLNPALDHSFLKRIKDQQLKEQNEVQDFMAKEKKEREKAARSRAQAKIDAMMEKQKLTNHETARLNQLIEKEAKRNSPPEPLEIKSSFVTSPKQEKNDSAYWNAIRPVPLTELEKMSFASKDSFLVKASRPEYKDSVKNSKRKFKPKHLLMGKTYYYSVDSLKRQENFSIPGILNPGALSFNSVDGLRTDLPFSYLKADSLGHILQVGSTLGYAFKREKLDASFRLARKWDGMSNGWFVFSLGSTTSDFNRNGGMTAIDNDFYTLWMEKNYKRFYRRDFLQLNASRDLANGLNFALTVDYSDNRQLSTHTSYSIINYDDREIQPNIPDNDLLQIGQLEDHQTLGARIQLQYTPRNRYRIRNNSKIYAGSRYPTFTMSYTKAFSGILGSDSKYDLLKLGVKQSISFGASNQFGYRIETGSFLNNDKVYFEDFRHFSALPVNFLFSPYRDSFRLLSMYSNSTNQRYVDAHANLITRKLLLKQLPILRKGSFTENLFLNYLTTLQLSNYVEAGYGISNFLMLFNLEVVAGFENGKYQSAGFKVSLNLK